MAANRYAEMVRWMAWPRIKNSRSSAQPGTQPHNGVQATVTPAPDAEPPPGSEQNTGVSGTRHAVAYNPAARNPGGQGPGPDDPAASWHRAVRRPRPIRYAHSTADEAVDVDVVGDETIPPTLPVEAAGGRTPATPPPAAPPGPEPSGTVLSRTVLSGTVLSGTVMAGPPPEDDEPEDDDDSTAGLVYEAPRQAYTEPSGFVSPDEPDEPDEPVPNEGLGIFGGVATTEVTDDDEPTREFERPGHPAEPGGPPPAAGPAPTRVIPIGAAWNQPIAAPPVASGAAEESKPNSFGRIRGMRRGAQPPDDDQPRVSIRDLPPDVQLRLWRLRVTIMVVVGVVFAILTRSWEIALTLAILAGIVDTVYRSRNAGSYRNGGSSPGARRRTSRQVAKMRREGYFVLDARPIPDSRESIDHLVVGPTGVYAIDSEKWDPKLPIRTWNGKKLYHGPESQKDRLEHAVWEATQASELLSEALGTEITVRPALAIYGPKIPWDIATIRNVDVFTGPALRKYLKRRGRMKDGVVRLTREEVRSIFDTASRVLPDVSSSSNTYTPVG
jgi:Nuclease-related domain